MKTAELARLASTIIPGGIDAWCRNNYKYRSEEKEIVRTPERMLYDLQNQGYVEGDCDDIAVFLCALGNSVGFRTRLTAIASTSDNPLGDLDHVFAEFHCNDAGWQIIDPTVPLGMGSYSVTAVYHEYV